MTKYIPIGRPRKHKSAAPVETPRDLTVVEARLAQQRAFECWYEQEQERERQARMLERARARTARRQARCDDDELAALLAKFEPWRDDGNSKVTGLGSWRLLRYPPVEFNGAMRRTLKLYHDYSLTCIAHALGKPRRCSEAHLAKHRAKIEASRPRFPKSYEAFKTAVKGSFLDLDDSSVLENCITVINDLPILTEAPPDELIHVAVRCKTGEST